MLDGILLSLKRKADTCDTYRAGETDTELHGLFICCLVSENVSVGKQTETASQCLPLSCRHVKAL